MSQVIRNFTTVAEVLVVGQIHGQETVNVYHFGRETPFNVDTILQDLMDLAIALSVCITEKLLPAVSSDWHLVKLRARTIKGGESDEVELGVVGDPVGALSPASHSFAATLLNLKTGGGGRSGRGKKFLPPVGEAETSASSIDGPTLVLLAAFITCLVEKFLGNPPQAEWNLVVFSKKNDAAREVKSIVVNPNTAVMHSRRRGSGN